MNWSLLAACVCASLVMGCGGLIEGPPDTEQSTTQSTTITESAPCGALQPCTDEAGEQAYVDGCAAQSPDLGTARGCELEATTPAECVNLATPAPLMCAGGGALRVVCCP